MEGAGGAEWTRDSCSAGGNLAMMLGVLPRRAGAGRRCGAGACPSRSTNRYRGCLLLLSVCGVGVDSGGGGGNGGGGGSGRVFDVLHWKSR